MLSLAYPPPVAYCQEVFYAFDDFVLLLLMIIISVGYKQL